MPLTDKGYVKRTALEIKTDIVNSLRQTIPEFTEQNADLQNNLIDSSIEGILVYEDMMNALFNAYSPDFSNDDIFFKFAESLGLRQKPKFQAQTTITFSGKYGDFIPKGTIITDENKTCEFITQDNVVCDTTGTASVLALSETEDIYPANTLTEIKTILATDKTKTPITATNKVDSLKYIAEETNAELKARSQAKLRSVRQGGKMYADGLLKGIDGVDRRLVAFYDKTIQYNEGDDKQFWVKGIEAVVGGGSDEEVAKALYLSFLETQKLISKPSNDETDRSKQVTLYIYDNPVSIEFTRPKVLEIGIMCYVAFTATLASPVALQYLTQNDVTKYVNSLKVGTNINKYSLIEIIMPLIVGAGMPSHTIKSIDFKYKIKGIDGERYKEFNKDGYIEEILFDCYTILYEYGFEINSADT